MNQTITAPRGFKAAGAHVGIKKNKEDLTLILCEKEATVAGCFTRNVVKAAPVIYDQAILNGRNTVRGIVINSGNANACTGRQGYANTVAMARTFAELTGCSTDEILVCSTGVIGQQLPIDIVIDGIKQVFPTLNDDEQAGKNACLGIMTTDTIEKYAYEEITLSGKTVKLAGICKGSGMIHPNMATMLSFVTTDVNISSELLRKALSESVSDTYNMVSVDRDTSTNDSAVVLASGLAENKLIDSENEEYFAFLAALNKVNKKLAMYIARDGEGATKLIEVTVSGADTDYNARKIAKAVVSSNLFKAAMFGADANWGRALCAMGYSGASFDPSKVRLEFSSKRGHITVYDTQPIVFDENEASEIISERKICVTISLDSSMSAGKDSGGFSAVAWGCDLTYDYVRINGDYRS